MRHLPPERALALVIGLLWLDGGVALLDLARGLIAHGTPSLGLGLWALWIAPGLRRRHPPAHRAAIAYSWLCLATLGCLAAAVSAGWVDPARLDWRILGVPMTGPRPSYAVGLCLTSVPLTGWQLHLLRRPDVRGLFAPVGSPLGAVTSPAGRGSVGRRRGPSHIRGRRSLAQVSAACRITPADVGHAARLGRSTLHRRASDARLRTSAPRAGAPRPGRRSLRRAGHAPA